MPPQVIECGVDDGSEGGRIVVQIKPNKTALQAKVRSVRRAPDGWGANVDLAIETSEAAAGYDDFLRAAPGSIVTVFAAEPERVELGKTYTVTASVLGGPQGERVVIEDVAPLPDAPAR